MSKFIIKSESNQFIENLLNKLIICKINNKSHEFYWIYNSICNGDSLEKIATEYLVKKKYSGYCFSDSTCGLFDAYIKYKNKKYFDPLDALYLSNIAGLLVLHKITDEITGEFKNCICFSVDDLIRELDGDGFFKWIESIAFKNNVHIAVNNDNDNANTYIDDFDADNDFDFDFDADNDFDAYVNSIRYTNNSHDVSAVYYDDTNIVSSV